MRRVLLFGGLGAVGILLLVSALLVSIVIGGSGVDESDSALEQREAREDAAGDPQQQPAPEPQPEPQPEAIEFSGTGPQATEPFELSAGLARFEMTHQGEGNFVVELLDDEGAEVGPSLMNEIGPLDSSSQVVQIPQDGTYLLNVDADGAWTIRVLQHWAEG